MGKIIALLVLFIWLSSTIQAQVPKYDVEIVTCVESLVPSGTGRSRMITTKVDVNYLDFTSTQTDAKGDKNKSKRKNIRLKEYEETKLLNLYNAGGIRIQNIASNDAMVSSKINDMLSNGWELFFVGTGVESKMTAVKKQLLKMGLGMLVDDTNSNANDPNGLFMTRYYFRKEIQ